MRPCASCNAPLRWERTEANNRPMPLNREPSSDGNVQLVDGNARVLAGLELLAAQDAGGELFVPHFQSCPRAAEHRKR